MLGRLTSALPVAFVLIATPVSGQGLSVGLVGGLNSATFRMGSAGDPEFSERRLGVTGGIAVRLDLSQIWALELEGLLVQKGFTAGPYYEMHVDYFEVPILIRANIPLSLGRVWPVLHAGVAPAREVRCSGWGTGIFTALGLPPSPVRQPFDCSMNRTRLWDLGALGGAGFGVDLGGFSLTGEARYSVGLVNLYPSSTDLRTENRGLSFLMTAVLPVF